MSTPAPDKITIQNYLINYAAAGTFNPVTYSPTGTNNARVATADTTRSVVPDSILCNEVRATFKPAKIQRRHPSVDRDQWFFQLHLAFTGEVALDVFEDAFNTRIPTQAQVGTVGSLLGLELFTAIYQQPTTSEPSIGTKVTYTIIAKVGPN